MLLERFTSAPRSTNQRDVPDDDDKAPRDDEEGPEESKDGGGEESK